MHIKIKDNYETTDIKESHLLQMFIYFSNT